VGKEFEAAAAAAAEGAISVRANGSTRLSADPSESDAAAAAAGRDEADAALAAAADASVRWWLAGAAMLLISFVFCCVLCALLAAEWTADSGTSRGTGTVTVAGKIHQQLGKWPKGAGAEERTQAGAQRRGGEGE
jgi:hypothetical protein